MSVHGSSIVADDFEVADSVSIGPFCVVGVDGEGGPPILGEGTQLRSHVVLYRGAVCGRDLHVGHHVLIRESCSIGASVSVGSGSILEHDVTVHDGVRMHSRCFVPEHSVLRAGAWLGPGVILTNARYPNREDTKAALEGVLVEEDVVLGAGAVVLPGVVVGRGALVGAGAVVVRDVPPGRTIVGNPGRVVA